MNINAAEFKAKCLKLIDEVAATHQPLVITKRGKPLVKLVPIEDETGADLFGYMKGTVTIADDIVQAVSDPWSAESEVGEGRRDATSQRSRASDHLGWRPGTGPREESQARHPGHQTVEWPPSARLSVIQAAAWMER